MSALARLPRRFAGRAADRIADAVVARLQQAPAEPAAVPPAPIDREGADNRNLELLLGFLLRADSNCIDVGANEGRFLAPIVARAPRGDHHAWEPLPAFAATLRTRFPTVHVHHAAVAETPGEAEFVVVAEDPAYSGLRERAYPSDDWHTERIRVPVDALDEVLPEDYVPTLIKIDVEGAELGVLRGARRLLTRHRPYVVFEHGVGASDRYGTGPEDIHGLLCGEVGLRIFDMDANGPLSLAQFTEIYRSGSRWNFIARP